MMCSRRKILIRVKDRTRSDGRKKTKGRQRIELEKLITFLKRRFEVYKKASELVTLISIQTAFMVYSKAGNPFKCEYIVNRFLDSKQAE
ncbi:MADS-box transcription factor family protein [Euphorbia peplus]|nr:MADS-box transcription factor family protein [Euphorbia peplus]